MSCRKRERETSVSTSTSTSIQTRSQKRRRTTVACNRCRSRKIKCNGTHPSCLQCLDSRLPCEYRTVATECIEELEMRLETVEAMVHTLQTSLGQPVGVLEGTRDQSPTLDVMSGDDACSSDDAPEESENESASGTSAFYGPSSTIAFLRQVLRSIDLREVSGESTSNAKSHVGRIKPEHSPPSSLFCKGTEPPVTAAIEDDLYVLPHSATTVTLVKNFFRGYGSMNPFLDEMLFMRVNVVGVYESRQRPKASRLALLNMVLAIGSMTSIDRSCPAERKIQLSKRFYQRARGLYVVDIFQVMDLELVQTFLLITQYLQCTKDCAKSWLTHGLTVQAATQLGLHAEQASAKYPNAEDESRSRTWHACVIMDRALSMQFGRPCLIPRQSEVNRQPDLRMSFTDGPVAGGADTIRLSFFRQSIKLYGILWVVLDSLYDQNCSQKRPLQIFELISRAASCEQELDQWTASLPDPFNINKVKTMTDAGTAANESEVLVTTLRLRYHGIRNLIHRPVLGRFLSNLGQSPDPISSEREYLLASCQHSLNISATSSAEIIALANSFEYGEVVPGMWWTMMHFVFNAAVTCFAISSLLSQDNEGQLQLSTSTTELKECIAHAAQALPKLAPAHPAIHRAAEFLERILKVCDFIARPSAIETTSWILQSLPESSEALLDFDYLNFLADFSGFENFVGESLVVSGVHYE